MRTQLEVAKFLCNRHEEIIEGIREEMPNHFISIDETDPDYDEQSDEMTDILIDLVCEGTEYRLRMGKRSNSNLRVSLVKFMPETEEDQLPTPVQVLLLEPDADARKTEEEWEQMIIGYVAEALRD